MKGSLPFALSSSFVGYEPELYFLLPAETGGGQPNLPTSQLGSLAFVYLPLR